MSANAVALFAFANRDTGDQPFAAATATVAGDRPLTSASRTQKPVWHCPLI
jgi:hypothetical protein